PSYGTRHIGCKNCRRSGRNARAQAWGARFDGSKVPSLWGPKHDAALARVGSRHLVFPERNNRRRWHAAARADPLVGSEEARTREPACVQLWTQFVEQRCIQAERHHGGDAISLELSQLPQDRIAIVVLGCSF